MFYPLLFISIVAATATGQETETVSNGTKVETPQILSVSKAQEVGTLLNYTGVTNSTGKPKTRENSDFFQFFRLVPQSQQRQNNVVKPSSSPVKISVSVFQEPQKVESKRKEVAPQFYSGFVPLQIPQPQYAPLPQLNYATHQQPSLGLNYQYFNTGRLSSHKFPQAQYYQNHHNSIESLQKQYYQQATPLESQNVLPAQPQQSQAEAAPNNDNSKVIEQVKEPEQPNIQNYPQQQLIQQNPESVTTSSSRDQQIQQVPQGLLQSQFVLQTPQYNFGYRVHDPYSGTNHGHVQIREGNNLVRGRYALMDSDGLLRTVSYTSDPVYGFNALVDRQPLQNAESSQFSPVSIGGALEGYQQHPGYYTYYLSK